MAQTPVARAHRLLWLDSRAGLTVGAIVLAGSPWLAVLYGLPLAFVVVMALANLAYGSFSFRLERRSVRPPAMLHTLIAANAAWGVACLVAAVLVREVASWIGIAQLLFEGVFVGGLAALEWRCRDRLWRRGGAASGVQAQHRAEPDRVKADA